MRNFLSMLFLAAVFSCAAEEFSIPLFYNGKPLPGFQAVGENAIALNAQFGQWGASQIPLKRGAGEYILKVEIVSPGGESSSGGFYLLYADGKQKQLSYGHRGKETPQTLTFKFQTEKPLKALLLKKMEKKNAPSVAVRSVKVDFRPAENHTPEVHTVGKVYDFQMDKLTASVKCRVSADGKKGAAVPGNFSRFGWNTVNLGKLFPAGSYELAAEFVLPAPNAARVALYTGGARQQQLSQPFSADRAGVKKMTYRFTTQQPFNSLVIKKMQESQQNSIGLGDFKLTMVKELRLSALQEIMRYPAPFGIRLNNSTALINGDKGSVNVEKWLDCASALADAAGELYMLELSAQGKFSCAAENAELEKLKALLRSNKKAEFKAAYPAFVKQVEALHAKANKLLGGEVLAEYGKDLWGHTKTFNHILHVENPEYIEPTPYRLAGPGFSLRFMKPAPGTDLASTRNSTIYHTPLGRFVFSSLTPVMTLDLNGTRLEAEHLSGSLDVKKINKNIWQLRKNLLLIGNGVVQKAEVVDGKLVVETVRPGRLGFLVLPPNGNAVKTGEFYLKYLATLPSEVLTVQNGNTVTLKAVTADGKKAGYIPVPPLLKVSLQSPYKVKYAGTELTPDDREIVCAEKFRYILPNRPVRTDNGINVWNDLNNKPELFKLLKKEGCDTIRLVIRKVGTKEQQKEQLLRNLKLASEAGLKIDIDNHAAFNAPKELGALDSPAAAEYFLKQWQEIIETAEPYRKHLAWYDLMNEPHYFAPPSSKVKGYWSLVRKVVPEMRKLDPDTPILIETANMGNPVGAREWETPDADNIIVGWHDYWPHIFTHQRVQEGGSEAMNRVAYPAFLPMISWVSPSWRNESSHWQYWDRHKKDGLIYDAVKLLVRTGLPGDCGEVGVVGYSGYMEYSGRIWMRDAVRSLRRIGVSHAVWGVHGGYVWNLPHCKDETFKIWKQK